MKELIAYILQFGNLNKQQIDLITGKAKELNLQKDDYFSEAGKVPRQVGFVVEGVLRGCYFNNQGEEITRCFISENSLVVDYVNFEANTFSSEYLQACTDCKLVVFSKQNWEELSQIIIDWDKIKFMENHPSLINRVPLTYIASYIGVTQQSLSRIRKNIS